MPVYEYECGECSKVFEVQQRIAEAPLSMCPECGGALRKLISMTSFQLKGGGWYADGYKGRSNGTSGDSGSGDKAAAPPCQGGAGSCSHCPAAT